MKDLALLFKKLLRSKEHKKADSIYDFFANSPEREQRKVIIKAIERANEDQRLLVEKYDKIHRHEMR